jgi:dihydroxyacid dehydratase/phosphogluconate dehydratase
MMLPPDVNNLYVIGRCASMTHGAQSAARVTGPCFAMGEAVGTAAWPCPPESAAAPSRLPVGGPLGLVRDGDVIEVDLAARTIELEVSAGELARRRAEFSPATPPAGCGWLSVYARSVGSLRRGATLGD